MLKKANGPHQRSGAIPFVVLGLVPMYRVVPMVPEILTEPGGGHSRVPACELPQRLPAGAPDFTDGSIMIRAGFQDT